MKIKKYGSTEQKVFEIALPLAEKVGLDIWDVRLEKEGALWYLRVFIDKEDGITIEDCEALHRPLDTALDEYDPIPHSYILEVGSSGLERELIREKHFEMSCGSELRIHLIRPVDDEKDFVGVLKSFDKEKILIENNSEMEFMLSDISYIRLYEEF